MTTTGTIGEALSPPGPFYRSVALGRDMADPAAGRSYVLTPWLERGLRELLAGLAPGSTRRAWRVVGDFGVGKSALALALLQALDPRTADPSMPVLRLHGTRQLPRMLPVVLTGSREGLAASLGRAVSAAAGAGLRPAGVRRVVAATDPFDALAALREAVRTSSQWDGVLLVVDEMGKFLEAAGRDGDADVFRLQDLAEAAARSGDAPFVVLLVLHKGFQSYADDWRAARRGEWEKVAERFDELVFDHPLSHSAALLRAALGVRRDRVPSEAVARHVAATARVRALGWLGPRDGAGEEGCWPLQPGAVPVLSRFFARFGQNERSLFGFAASEEPTALRAFADAAPAATAMYGVPEFFDHVAASFGHRLASRGGAGEWERIGSVVERLADADPVEAAIVRTVGILNLLDAFDLAPTADAVGACLEPAFGASAIDEAVERLVRGGLLFRRPGREELRLWTSRRVDLSLVWNEADRAVDAADVTARLREHLAALPVRRHILARRHSIATGTSRRFEVTVSPFGGLAEHRPSAGADGRVTAVLCGDEGEVALARAWALEATAAEPTLVVLVVRPLTRLGPLMTDLLRHRWLIGNAASLQEDAFALGENERATADLEGLLVSGMEAALGLAGRPPTDGVDMVVDGASCPADRPLHVVASDRCDAAYASAPLVENDLVNRHALTSAGAGARQRLIEAVFAHSSDPELGFSGRGNPPERALYLSLLRRGRLHREGPDGWSVRAPALDDDPLRLGPALDLIASTLRTSQGRVGVAALYARLAERPFGVRRGLVPLLLAVVLSEAGHRVALFERGTFSPRLDGAAFMRILKAPERFELQWMALEGVRADVFARLVRLLGREGDATGLLSVVEPLVRFGADLPLHVRHSARLGLEAKAVLRELGAARSPVDLVFRQLPEACGCPPVEPGSRVGTEAGAEYVARLDGAVSELRGCYPRLLEEMRAAAFAATGAEGRSELARRAGAIAFRLAEQRLRTFALRLSDAGQADDPWTEALGGALLGKPPSRWLEQDVEIWRARLEELSGLLLRAEAAAFGEGGVGREAVRLSVTRSDGIERAVVVGLDDVTPEERLVAAAAARVAAKGSMGLDRLVALLSLQSIAEEGRSLGESGRNAEASAS